jgi:endonuclease/exonuclease/phosphatase family metal-dependent hydrolase
MNMSGIVDIEGINNTLKNCVWGDLSDSNEPPCSEIICLQELDTLNPRSSWLFQAKVIAKSLNKSYHYSNSFTTLGLLGFGNVTLTDLPIHSTWNKRLPFYPAEPRMLLETIVFPDDRKVHVFNTHWGLNKDQRLASGRFCGRIVKGIPNDEPVIFCGDLNASLESEEVQMLVDISGLKGVGSKTLLPTYPSDNPRKRIDHILLSKHFNVESVDVVKSDASDHLPLIAKVSL